MGAAMFMPKLLFVQEDASLAMFKKKGSFPACGLHVTWNPQAGNEPFFFFLFRFHVNLIL